MLFIAAAQAMWFQSNDQSNAKEYVHIIVILHQKMIGFNLKYNWNI